MSIRELLTSKGSLCKSTDTNADTLGSPIDASVNVAATDASDEGPTLPPGEAFTINTVPHITVTNDGVDVAGYTIAWSTDGGVTFATSEAVEVLQIIARLLRDPDVDMLTLVKEFRDIDPDVIDHAIANLQH